MIVGTIVHFSLCVFLPVIQGLGYQDTFLPVPKTEAPLYSYQEEHYETDGPTAPSAEELDAHGFVTLILMALVAVQKLMSIMQAGLEGPLFLFLESTP